MTSLTCDIRSSGSADVVEVCGELDLATVGDFEAAIEGRAAAGRHVTLDLSRLSFCGCVGVSALLRLQSGAARCGGYVRLSRLAPEISRILRLCGVDLLVVPGDPPAVAERHVGTATLGTPRRRANV